MQKDEPASVIYAYCSTSSVFITTLSHQTSWKENHQRGEPKAIMVYGGSVNSLTTYYTGRETVCVKTFLKVIR